MQILSKFEQLVNASPPAYIDRTDVDGDDFVAAAELNEVDGQGNYVFPDESPHLVSRHDEGMFTILGALCKSADDKKHVIFVETHQGCAKTKHARPFRRNDVVQGQITALFWCVTGLEVKPQRCRWTGQFNPRERTPSTNYRVEVKIANDSQSSRLVFIRLNLSAVAGKPTCNSECDALK